MIRRRKKWIPVVLVTLLTSWSAVASGEQPVALRPSDDQIELLVTQALAETPGVESYEILVLADEAEVTLFGSVDAEEDRRLAEDIAAQIEGVAGVHNDIHVVEPVYQLSKSDRDIEADFWKIVPERLKTVPSSLEIWVIEGRLVLSGRVASRVEWETLVEAAFDAGAILVKPELEIDSASEKPDPAER